MIQPPSFARREVVIGVLASGGPLLGRTLETIRRNTEGAFRLVVIDDGLVVGAPEREALAGAEVLRHAYPHGPAACFNELVAATREPFLVVMREGCCPARGWLSSLLSALRTKPEHGIAGPSTSLSWNEQQVVARPDWDDARVEAYAARLRERHADRLVCLDELHNAADFCFAFKREVADEIGPFDEGYGLGPCFEIDFCTRAARAGYKAVWAQAAFVYRAPRLPHEPQAARRLALAKARYQSKFCGLKLGLSGRCATDFEHCLGEACSVFAPADRIAIREAGLMATRGSSDRTPLVSCIMPTRDRRTFAARAIQYFQRQDYPMRELVVVDDGDDPIADLAHARVGVRYIRPERCATLGQKRNLAVEAARGSVIAHWDDDDWYSPERLSRQVAPIIDGRADMTGFDLGTILDVEAGAYWAISPELHDRMLVGDLPGSTFVYRRSLWEAIGGFPGIDLAEDADFIARVLDRNSRILKIANAGAFAYIRHGANTWQFEVGKHVDPQEWTRLERPPWMPAEDAAFYDGLRGACPAGTAP